MKTFLTAIVSLLLASAARPAEAQTAWVLIDKTIDVQLNFEAVDPTAGARLAKELGRPCLVLAELGVFNLKHQQPLKVDMIGLVEVTLKDGRKVRSVDLSWDLYLKGKRGTGYLFESGWVGPWSDRRYMVAFTEAFSPGDVMAVTLKLNGQTRLEKKFLQNLNTSFTLTGKTFVSEDIP